MRKLLTFTKDLKGDDLMNALQERLNGVSLIVNGVDILQEIDHVKSAVTSLFKELDSVKRTIQESFSLTNQLITDSAVTKVIGRTTVINPHKLDELKSLSNLELRFRANKYAKIIRALKGGKSNTPWNLAYNKLYELTGYNVFEKEKIHMYEDGKNYGPSWLNTVTKDGYLPHVVLILEDIANSL